jgi:hypothetical protein
LSYVFQAAEAVFENKIDKIRIYFRSLVIVKYPNAVLQKGKQFETEVRLLLNLSASTAIRIRIINMCDAEMLEADYNKSATM